VSTLERVNCAALVIDGRGRVNYANRPAKELMGDGVALVRGRLTASDPASNCRLQKLISFALVVAAVMSVRNDPGASALKQ
jgi:hypothetical protein